MAGGESGTGSATPSAWAAIIGRAATMSKPAPPTPALSADQPRPRVALVGWGLITPLGEGAWATFTALLAGRTLADRAPKLPQDIEPVDLARSLGCVGSAQNGRYDPAVELAERAVREAVTMVGLEAPGLPLWLGTSKGAVASLSQRLGKGRPIDDETAQCVALGPHGYLADRLTKRLHTRPMTHHVAACSSGLVALDAARRSLIHSSASESPYALVASTDAAITPAFVHSYRRLGVLGTMTAAAYTQRPLDERRMGFMLSEMGVAVLLKRVDPGEPMPDNAIELVETQTACEPYDMVRSPAQMTGLAELWRRVSAGRQMDLIHPHAPGTVEHDPAELGVLLQTPSPSGSHTPDVYAVKGAIGHGLGASGLASLVIAAMTLKTGRRPPMPWLSEPMKLPGGRRLETDSNARSCSRSGTQAVLAAGFGGHLAAAVLQGPQRDTADDSSSKPRR